MIHGGFLMKQCDRCLVPETKESIFYDECGICNVCRQHEVKKEKIDWKQRRKELDDLISQYKGKYDYDCIVPFSGGKDSTFTLYYLVRDCGLSPLVVSFDHWFYRPKVNENRIRTLKKLNVDYMQFKPKWHVVRKLMLEALRRKGDFCWHCHTGVFAYPMQIALKFNIPLIFWGEPNAEYAGHYDYESGIEEVDDVRFNRYINLGINAEDMVGMLEDPSITMRDLKPYQYPDPKQLRAINYRSVCLGSYIPWDVKKQAKLISDELGWKGDSVEGIPPEYSYEKIECMFTGVRDYLKYIKRGFGRTMHLVNIDIRNGRITKEKARELIEKYDGKRPASLDVLLEYLGISEEEFLQIATEHVVSPHVYDPGKIKRGDPLWDQKLWDRTKVD